MRTLARHLALAAACTLGLGLLLSFLVRLDGPSEVDLDLTRALHDRAVADGVVADVALGVTTVGDPVLLAVMVVVISGGLFLRGHRRTAIWLGAVTAVASITGSLLKIVVGRSRPDFDSVFLDTVTRSFPSGHAFNTTVVLGSITVALVSVATARHAPVVRVAAAMVAITALAVGLTRPLLGVHFVSDVVAGWALGVLWLVLTRPRPRPRVDTDVDTEVDTDVDTDAEVRREQAPTGA